jgi:hypothetical protein
MKPILKFAAFILLTGTITILSCQKENSQKDNPQEFSTSMSKANNVNKIMVADINQLYEEVNNPDNAGSLLVLAPGIYMLNASYLNGGRLELQMNMSLTGQPGHPESVVIDESALPAASFTIPSVRTGGIRMGLGTNNLEWLTVKGGTIAANAFSVIDTDLPSTETHIGIFHINIIGNGSSVGIDIRNRRPEQAGRKIYADLEHNDISGVITFLGPGIEIQNANNASGSFIKVNLLENYIYGNRVGVGAFNNAASSTVINSSIEVTSHADHIEENGVGLFLGGGLSQVATALGNGNTTIFEAYGSSIRNNNPSPMPPELLPNIPIVYIPCGIYTFGGISTSVAGNNKSSDNTLKINFLGCDISDNNSPDINAFGAFCQPQALLAGTNNLVEIQINGNSTNVTAVATPSIPAEPAGTNIVNIYR